MRYCDVDEFCIRSNLPLELKNMCKGGGKKIMLAKPKKNEIKMK